MLSEEGRALSVGGAASSRRPSGIAGAEPFRPAVDSGTTPERKGGTVTAGVTAGPRAALPGVSSKCPGSERARADRLAAARGREREEWFWGGGVSAPGCPGHDEEAGKNVASVPVQRGDALCVALSLVAETLPWRPRRLFLRRAESAQAGSFVRARRECARRTEPEVGRAPEVSPGS